MADVESVANSQAEVGDEENKGAIADGDVFRKSAKSDRRESSLSARLNLEASNGFQNTKT